MLEVRGVSARFGEVLAIAPLDFAFPPGQTTALIGPSGCGKSTLLKLLMGLIPPATGSVHVDGQRLTSENARALRHRMGYVIQEGGLFPHLTCRGNVTLLAEHLGWDGARVGARVTELAALVRLPEATLGRYPHQLSGGQRQRVGLMRALFLDPDALLLDEPLGALDPLVRRTLQGELKEIFQALGKTVVLVTHDMGEAAFFGDPIILLQAGRVAQVGPIAELVRAPAAPFVRRFIEAQRSPLDAFGEDA